MPGVSWMKTDFSGVQTEVEAPIGDFSHEEF